MKTLMVMLVVLISLLIQADGSYYGEEDILGPNLDVILKRRPIRKIRNKCSDYSYGCCQDNETPAPPPERNLNKDQRCGRVLCFDASPDYCQKNKNNCGDVSVQSRCAFTCKIGCQHRASPKDRCEKNKDAPHGCCWNGVPATGPNNQGCTQCKDQVSEKRCKKWKRNNDNKCVTGKFGPTDYLAKNCAKFCDQC